MFMLILRTSLLFEYRRAMLLLSKRNPVKHAMSLSACQEYTCVES